MVLADGAIGVLGANGHTAQAYFPTWISTRVQHNCANGSGIGFGDIS